MSKKAVKTLSKTTTINFLVHFFAVTARLRHKKSLTSLSMNDVSKQRRNFLSIFELGILFLGILIQDNSPTFEKVGELE